VESGLLLLWNFNEFLWLIQKDREIERERERECRRIYEQKNRMFKNNER
jgi:hypothetical protein